MLLFGSRPFHKAMYLDSGERVAVEGLTIIKDIRTEQEAIKKPSRSR